MNTEDHYIREVQFGVFPNPRASLPSASTPRQTPTHEHDEAMDTEDASLRALPLGDSVEVPQDEEDSLLNLGEFPQPMAPPTKQLPGPSGQGFERKE